MPRAKFEVAVGFKFDQMEPSMRECIVCGEVIPMTAWRCEIVILDRVVESLVLCEACKHTMLDKMRT